MPISKILAALLLASGLGTLHLAAHADESVGATDTLNSAEVTTTEDSADAYADPDDTAASVISPELQKYLDDNGLSIDQADQPDRWWGRRCLRGGTPCRHANQPCCSGQCVFVNHGTDYCSYYGGGGGGGWGRCLRGGTPCRHATRACCTHCVVVNHGTDYCAY